MLGRLVVLTSGLLGVGSNFCCMDFGPFRVGQLGITGLHQLQLVQEDLEFPEGSTAGQQDEFPAAVPGIPNGFHLLESGGQGCWAEL